MRIAWIVAATLALAAPALAQEEPTVTEADYDTSVPPSDESYLNDSEAEYAPTPPTGEPTLAEGDLDTSLPPEDDGYLRDAEREYADPTAPTPAPPASPTPGADTPFLGPLGLAAALMVALLARRR